MLRAADISVSCPPVLHSAAVFARIMSPTLYNPSVRRREYASITVLNAFTLAVACWCALCSASARPPQLNPVAIKSGLTQG